MNIKPLSFKSSSLALAFSALVVGCGGGGSDTEPTPADASAATPAPASPSAPAPSASAPTASSKGVLGDAPVQGVAYSTSSGAKGVTDALGQYDYNAKDTVSFKLGALELGSVSAGAMVTPLDLAAGNANKLQNLLVLLQSLDDDGVLTGGIKITDAAATAVGAAIDLGQAPAVFASVANTGLAAAMTGGGIGRAIVTIDQAERHFMAQFQRAAAGQIWVWREANNSEAAVFLRLGSAGEYLFAQIDKGDNCCKSGLEVGSAVATSVDARGFKLTRTIAVDTNGEWGLSHPGACDRVRVIGDKLHYLGADADCVINETAILSKAENEPNGIVGVWALEVDKVQTTTLVFWADGRYLMVDIEGDTVNHCGGPGVEYGSYSYNATSKEFKVLGATVDTNGCAGFVDGNDKLAGTFAVSSSGSEGVLAPAGSPETYRLFRLSK